MASRSGHLTPAFIAAAAAGFFLTSSLYYADASIMRKSFFFALIVPVASRELAFSPDLRTFLANGESSVAA